MLCIAFLTLVSLLASHVGAQHTTSLPPPPSYPQGKFTNPDTSIDQIFRVGDGVNVTWKTTYSSVTLWLIYDNQFNSPYLCTSGTSQRWWQWTVDDHGNNTRPFSFRAVNTDGSKSDQESGGFYTGQFWILDADKQSTTSATTRRSTITSPPSTAHSTSTVQPNSTSTTTASSSSSSTSSSSSNATAIGVGVGVGVGAAALIIAAFALWCVRRRRTPNSTPTPTYDTLDAPAQQQPPWNDKSAKEHFGPLSPPSDQVASPEPAELDAPQQHKYISEAPANQQEPRELAADNSTAQLQAQHSEATKPPNLYG